MLEVISTSDLLRMYDCRYLRISGHKIRNSDPIDFFLPVFTIDFSKYSVLIFVKFDIFIYFILVVILQHIDVKNPCTVCTCLCTIIIHKHLSKVTL